MTLLPGFSSDGKRVAFVTQRASIRIWQYTPTGSGVKDGRPLSPDGGSALALDVSPDGDSVLYNFVQPGRSLTPRWWLIRPGRAPTELAGADGQFARLSRNGERLAYTKMRTDDSGRLSANAIAVRTIGGREHLITPWIPGACCRAACDWSPDDQFVLACGPTEEMATWPVDEATNARPSRVIFRLAQHNVWQGQYLTERTLAGVRNAAYQGSGCQPGCHRSGRPARSAVDPSSPSPKMGRQAAMVSRWQDVVFSGRRQLVYPSVGSALRSRPRCSGWRAGSAHTFRRAELQNLSFDDDYRDGRWRRQGVPDDGIDVGQRLDAGQR